MDAKKSTAVLLTALIGILCLGVGVGIMTSESIRWLAHSAVEWVGGADPGRFWADKMNWLGVEAVAEGLLIIMAALLWKKFQKLFQLLSQNQRLLITAAVLVMMILWLPSIWFGHSAQIGGERYWWLGDDAMISMRYAHHLASGDGLVWNLGERVEGYTNFLWTLYMALVHLLPISMAKTSLVILLTNLFLAMATLPVLTKLVLILGGKTLTVAMVLAAFILNENLLFWTAAGFEMTLLTLLFLWSLYRIIQEAKVDHPRLVTFLLIGVISLVRADAVVISMLCYALALILHRRRYKVLGYSTLALLLPAAQLGFRLLYYGELLPNTAYLKVGNWDGRYLHGLSYLFSFIQAYAPLLLLALVGVILRGDRTRRILFGIFLCYAAYIAFIGGDVFSNFRFFIPVIPLVLILAFLGVQSLWKTTGIRLLAAGLCLTLAPLMLPGYASQFYPRAADVGNVKIGLLLKENTPPDARVADFWAGSVFYFSDRYAIDLLGKADKTIAREPAFPDGMLPGHNKFDFAYSLGKRKPDFLVASFKLPVNEDFLKKIAAQGYAFTPRLYFNDIFREDYLSHPVIADSWRTIFARRDVAPDVTVPWTISADDNHNTNH